MEGTTLSRGVFITIEGPDGAGKTTVLEKVAKQLKDEGYPIVLTREPGGIPIAEQIRHVILNRENTTMDPRTEGTVTYVEYVSEGTDHPNYEAAINAAKEAK